MSLIAKIPPLVSALAFGYGVGMAAPDGTLGKIQDLAAGHAPVTQKQATQKKYVALDPKVEAKLPGGESPALMELRAQHTPGRYSRGWDTNDFEARGERKTYDDDMAAEADELESVETAAVSRLQLPDLGLGVSRQTLKYVKFFTKTDRGRSLFETWLKRSGRYQELVQDELRSRNLPEDLIWVAMIESGFDPTAKSPAGAVGLWQFMPATGAVYGLRQNKFVDQRKNPKLATQAAAHHLRDLYMRFGQWDLALAAYNMGYEQLLDRIDRVGTTDFNELSRAGALPSETAKYVPKILAAAIVANNLERFGFDDVEVKGAENVAEIAVPPQTSLETIAKAAGCSTSTVRKLNPDLLTREMPPGKGDMMVNVPPESVSRAIAALPTMLEQDQLRTHRADDVLDPMDLMSPEGYRQKASQSEDESLLSYLPPPKKKRRSLRSPVDEDGGDNKLDDLADVRAQLGADRDAARGDRETLAYKVGEGDTLLSIARQFATDVDDVARDNGLASGEKVKEGAIIKLKVRRDVLNGLKGEGRGTARGDRDASPAKKSGKDRDG